MKAGLILRGIGFGKQHDIDVLAGKLGWDIGATDAELEMLSAYNSEARDPDSGGEASNDQEAAHAMSIANQVVSAVTAKFNELNISTDGVQPT